MECFAGRTLRRQDRLAGLDWATPCPVPAEESLPMQPPWWFCVPHYDAVIDYLWPVFAEAGLIDQDIGAGPGDEFDEIMSRLEQGE